MPYGRIRCQLELERRGNGGKMESSKTSVSTSIDTCLFHLLDSFCARTHRNRAQVMRGLLYGLLVEGNQSVFDGPAPAPTIQSAPLPRLNAKERILRTMRRHGEMTFREMRRNTIARMRVCDWKEDVQALVDANELRISEERMPSGHIRRIVRLVKQDESNDGQ
jgi:hypothetical protein